MSRTINTPLVAEDWQLGSSTNLRYFRQSYTVYTERSPQIRHIQSGELTSDKQLFAAKYILYLPSEEELVREIEREKRLIEIEMADKEEEVE